MNKGIKAALLSAFVFPGVGHFVVKKYSSALLFIVSAGACVYFLLNQAWENALNLVEKMQSGMLVGNLDQISQMVDQQVSAHDAMMSNVVSGILLLLWIVSIVDGYRIGKKVGEKNNE